MIGHLLRLKQNLRKDTFTEQRVLDALRYGDGDGAGTWVNDAEDGDGDGPDDGDGFAEITRPC